MQHILLTLTLTLTLTPPAADVASCVVRMPDVASCVVRMPDVASCVVWGSALCARPQLLGAQLW